MSTTKFCYKTSKKSALIPKLKQRDYLLECFDTILKDKHIRLNMKKILHIIVCDLSITLDNISSPMKYILCKCLCYYMKIWPGWNTYRSVHPDVKEKEIYQAEFKDYLILKLKYIIHNETKFYSVYSIESDKVLKPQINSIKEIDKSEAPYSLIISGEPYFLNNIGFIKMENNIIITPHTGRPWTCLNIRQFLNYPFVQVHIKLPDLELTRENSHLFLRYISNYEDIECPQTNFIDFVRRKNLREEINVYALDFISTYCRQFIELIKKQYTINKCKIFELEMIFKQFLWDIEESNLQQCLLSSGEVVNTMATDVAVCFNIGGHVYLRNKKMSASGDHFNKEHIDVINFSEIIIPKMMFTLNRFTAKQDNETSEISFKSLNEMHSKLNQNFQERCNFSEIIHNSVSYSCLLCMITYEGDKTYNDISEHFKTVHKGEQSVVCFKCKKEFAIAHLAGSRWTHNCEKQRISTSTEVNISSSNACSVIENVSQKTSDNSDCLQEVNLVKNNLSLRKQDNKNSPSIIKEQPCITDQMTCSIPFVALSTNTLVKNTIENAEVHTTQLMQSSTTVSDIISKMRESFSKAT